MSTTMPALLDIVLIVAIAASVPVAVSRPWIGVLVWHWFGILQPHRFLSGAASGAPLAQPVALATLAGLFFASERHRMPRTATVWCAGTLWLVFLASTLLTAIDPPMARHHFLAISKSMLMTACTVMLVQDTHRLRVLLWVAALSIGALAAGGAVWVVVNRAAEPLYGPPGAELGDNNDLAAGLVLAAPLMAFLAGAAREAWARHAMTVLFGLTVFSTLGTHSRAGFLGLAVVLGGTALLRHWKMLAAAAAAAALFFAVSARPEQWIDRMETMTTPSHTIATEGSMSTRVRAWSTAVALGLDHPVLGAGFEPFRPEVYRRYNDGYSDFHNAHNILLQVFAEHGLLGLLLYIGVLASALWSLEQTARRPAQSADTAWLAPAARAVQLGLTAYGVAGMFQCLSYREVLQLWVAFAIVLDVVSRGAATPAASPAAAMLERRRERA